jgi:mono/diheme cytochrome c family protein
MSKKDKRQNRQSGSTGAPERRVTEAVHIAGDDREPIAENRPVPVLLIALLVALLFWGDMYIMRNGGDVGGEAGAFPAKVYDPYKTYAAIPKADGGAAVGGKMYAQNCAICHQTGGTGIPGQFPPLAGSEWVLEEGPNRVIKLILNGIQGPITVSGQPFNNAMPPWRDIMTDEQIAAVASYVRSTWGNKAPPVKPEEVKAQRDATAGRSTAWSAAELLAQPTK